MAAKTPKVHVNANGEHIMTMADGSRHLHPAHSKFRAKLLAAIPDHKEAHGALIDAKHLRVARKKARQQRKGWPPEKSPV